MFKGLDEESHCSPLSLGVPLHRSPRNKHKPENSRQMCQKLEIFSPKLCLNLPQWAIVKTWMNCWTQMIWRRCLRPTSQGWQITKDLCVDKKFIPSQVNPGIRVTSSDLKMNLLQPDETAEQIFWLKPLLQIETTPPCVLALFWENPNGK